jgi:ATP-dependent Clp protease ATP-binding subunit ClpA
MVEPSENLQKIFDKALDVTKKLNHEYLTLEHLLFSMLCEEDFSNIVSGFDQVDPEFMKKNVENFLKTKCDDLLMTDIENLPKKWKPKKTQAVERVLNRAFTQVLFSGRNSIEVTDVFLSMFNEKKS